MPARHSVVYTGLITEQRQAIEQTGGIDDVTQDLLIQHSRELEQFHWFIRSHLEDSHGHLATSGAEGEQDAVERVGAAVH